MKFATIAWLLAASALPAQRPSQDDIRWWQKQALLPSVVLDKTPGHIAEKHFGSWRRVRDLCFLDTKTGEWYESAARTEYDPVWKTLPKSQYAIINCSSVAGR